MGYGLQPIDGTIEMIGRVYPGEQPATKFDKLLKLIKAFSPGSIPGTIGQAIETTAKVCATISCSKHKTQAVKYAADAYEVKCRSEVELARIRERQSKNHAVTLYIEKDFQYRIDELNKNYLLLQSHLEKDHGKTMRQIEVEREKAIRQMDNIAKEHLHQIDNQYSAIIRRNEGYCLLYREYLKSLNESNASPGAMINEISKRYMDIVEKAVMNPTTNVDLMTSGLDQAMKLLQFLGEPDHYFIRFDRFITQKKMIEGF